MLVFSDEGFERRITLPFIEQILTVFQFDALKLKNLINVFVGYPLITGVKLLLGRIVLLDHLPWSHAAKGLNCSHHKLEFAQEKLVVGKVFGVYIVHKETHGLHVVAEVRYHSFTKDSEKGAILYVIKLSTSSFLAVFEVFSERY